MHGGSHSLIQFLYSEKLYVKDSAETEKILKITAVCASSSTCALKSESTLAL